MCCLSLAFPAQTPPAFTDVRHLQVKIPHSDVISASLGSSVTLPCLVSLSSAPASSSSPSEPRVKWTVVSGGVETQILVARGQRVKINEAYRERAALSNYTSSPDDLSLWLADLRTTDSGHYRCEVQQGLEDAADLVQLKVRGVVFHYRDALGRYAFSFHQAQGACEAIGAKIASPDQLLAAYHDGYEQCDAGWLSDQSVRYPIQVPREGCYGDMDGQPGVRNYGTMDAEDLYDVYCYIDQIDGEVFHDSVPQQLSFTEAQSYCRGAEGELATTAQLYLAWSEGLDRCSPGWLSDGSVRYPIIAPRERCGGPQAGVKTVYRFSNQTGFPEPSSLHDVYCFRGNQNAATVSPMDYVVSEPDDIGQDVIILTEPDQELPLNQNEEHVEREVQSVLVSFPFFSRSSTDENLVSTHPTVTSGTTESTLNATSTPDLLQLFNETSTPTEMSNSTEHPTAVTSTLSSAETYNSTQNMTVLSGVTNDTDSNHTLILTVYEPELENTTAFLEPHTPHQMQRVLDSNPEEPKESTQPSQIPEQSQETTDFISLQVNFSEMNSTSKENVSEVVPVTSDPMLQVKLEEAVVDDPMQVTLSTESPREEEEVLTQTAQSTEPPTKTLTSLWIPVDGSGDTSQETDLNVDAASFITEADSSTLDSTTDLPPSAVSSGATVTATDITPTSESDHSDKVHFFSTSEQPWQSSMFRQEGSTSIETEDTVTVENEEKELHLHVSGISFATTEAPEVWSANSTTPPYWTSSPRMHLEAVTDAYQEASGHEPETVITILEDVSPIFEDEEVTPTLQEDVSIKPTAEEEDEKVNFEDEVSTATSTPEYLTETQTLEEEDEVNPALNENVTATTEEVTEEEKFNSTHEEEEVTVVPFDSQTSNWSPLTTTTGPQESLNSLEYSRTTSTAAPDSPSSTNPPMKTSTTTITTTTHWSRRSWSSTTAEPKAHHETAEPQKVTAHIPPVDHGRPDVEFSLTQSPTLLILPNERAAVGGAGKASDACLDDPCFNGGTCTDRGGEIKCLCLPTYGGQFCQTDLERCELGWDKFQGFCYRHFSQRLSWEVAEQHCRMLGAHLVSIMSPEEQTYLNSYYKEYQWTGLNDKTIEDDFRWSDGNPLLYENWYRGQPDSYFLSGEDCVVMVWHDDGRWSDVPCNYHLAYTCKKSTSSCGPPPKVRNASIFGKVRQRYETNAAVRYYCAQGFQQRLKPLIRCLSGGTWEKPQIMCIPEPGSPTQNPEETSPTNNFTAIEDEFESTKESPQYWDIKF